MLGVPAALQQQRLEPTLGQFFCDNPPGHPGSDDDGIVYLLPGSDVNVFSDHLFYSVGFSRKGTSIIYRITGSIIQYTIDAWK